MTNSDRLLVKEVILDTLKKIPHGEPLYNVGVADCANKILEAVDAIEESDCEEDDLK